MCAKTVMKNVMAGLCLLSALVFGLPMMLTSENNIHVKVENVPQVEQFYDLTVNQILDIPAVATMVEDGLKPYFLGMGLIFLLVAMAFVLVDGNEHITTLTGRETDEVF